MWSAHSDERAARLTRAAGGGPVQDIARAGGASRQAFLEQQAMERTNAIRRRNDLAAGAGAPVERTPEVEAAINKSANAYAGAGGQFREPIEAGTLDGNRVQVTGPNSIRKFLPSGGTQDQITSAGGKPVDAHLYLHGQQKFAANPEYAKQFMAAGERAAGVAPVEQPTIAQSGGGPVLQRGGVSTPIENLSPAERVAQGAGGPLDYLRAGPTSLAIRDKIGRGVEGIANFIGGAANAVRTAATQAAPFVPAFSGEPAPAAVGPPVGAMMRGGVGYGGGTEAGVSNRQAAPIQTPTAASPTPRTPTSPATDINKTLISSRPEPAGTPTPTPTPGTAQARLPSTPAVRPGTPAPLAQEWEKRRFAYEGF
jgi:hypothetical protein